MPSGDIAARSFSQFEIITTDPDLEPCWDRGRANQVGHAQEKWRQPQQELFLTETVYPQEKHELQVTLGALVDRTRSDSAAWVPFSAE